MSRKNQKQKAPKPFHFIVFFIALFGAIQLGNWIESRLVDSATDFDGFVITLFAGLGVIFIVFGIAWLITNKDKK